MGLRLMEAAGSSCSVMAIEPFGKALMGTILRYDYKVRDAKELLRGVPSPRIQRK